jgi:glycosyltransferase involved in cell wall biosynthesis
MARAPHAVTHVVSSLEYGGLEKLVVSFAEHCDRKRFRLRVLTCMAGGPLAERLHDLGIDVQVLGGVGLVGRVLSLRRNLRSQPTEILHTHNPGPHLIGALTRSLVSVPVLVHTKHGRNPDGGWRGRVLNHLAARATNALVGVSKDTADTAVALEHVPAARVRVIWNGVDLGPMPTARLRGSRAICVARLNPIKDHETLLRAARLVADHDPRFELELVGDGVERERIERLRDSLGLGDRIRLSGARHDVRARLDRADVFVMASVSEGISLTILEAMAAGLPTIVTAVGGNPEIVVDGVTGRLVPPRDPGALARALQEVLSDPGGAAAMGRAARARVEESFDVRRMVGRYEALYEELLSSAAASRRI